MLTGKQPPRASLGPSHEHYLRAIWEVRSRQGYARLVDVARELGVTPPTLSVGIKTLEARELVTHDAHRFLVLTDRGDHMARELHHRFMVTVAFLTDVLGVPPGPAREEACRLEHDVSAVTVERLLDLIKLMREDRELGEMLERRLAEYRRSCRGSECATCDLTCMSATLVARP